MFKDACSGVLLVVVVIIGLVVTVAVIDVPVLKLIEDERGSLVLSDAAVSVSGGSSVDITLIDEITFKDVAVSVDETVVCDCAAAPKPGEVGGVVCKGKDLVVCVADKVEVIVCVVVVFSEVAVDIGVCVVVLVRVVGVEDVVVEFVSLKIMPPREEPTSLSPLEGLAVDVDIDVDVSSVVTVDVLFDVGALTVAGLPVDVGVGADVCVKVIVVVLDDVDVVVNSAAMACVGAVVGIGRVVGTTVL